MKPNELMIDNWVYSLIVKNGETIREAQKVRGISSDMGDYIQTYSTDTWYHIGTFEPIILSIEILENSGFLYGFCYYSENVPENLDPHIEFLKKSWGYIDTMEEVSICFPNEDNKGKVIVSNKDKKNQYRVCF